MESKSIAKLTILHPSIRQDALDAYSEAVIATPKYVHPFITDTYRSFDEQAKLYQQGRTTKGDIVTYAKAGESFHNYYLAIDFVLFVNNTVSWNVDMNWMIVVNCFKKHGFQWGGNFPQKKIDEPHLEKTSNHTWEDCLALYQGNKFIPNTKYLQL